MKFRIRISLDVVVLLVLLVLAVCFCTGPATDKDPRKGDEQKSK